MRIAHPSAVVQKKDLHIGGLGLQPVGALAAITPAVQPIEDAWARRTRELARLADEVVREHSWAALATVAMLGLAAGYLLSRRD